MYARDMVLVKATPPNAEYRKMLDDYRQLGCH
jgi:hypothetical protein